MSRHAAQPAHPAWCNVSDCDAAIGGTHLSRVRLVGEFTVIVGQPEVIDLQLQQYDGEATQLILTAGSLVAELDLATAKALRNGVRDLLVAAGGER